jgi:hypothetical protein
MTGQSGAVAFRRVVIRFCDTFGSVSSLEVAAGFARTLRSELVGIFIEDEGLMEWSSSPLARQIPMAASSGTSAPSTGRGQEMTAAVMNVRRRFTHAATALGLHTSFEVERASAASLESAGAAQDDLLVVIEPADPLARQSYPFTAILEAVVRYAGPVLYVPRNVRRLPISAVTLAKDASEEVQENVRAIAAQLGVKAIEVDQIREARSQRGEILIAFDRRNFEGERDFRFAAIAAERGAPALVLGNRSAP